MERRARFLERMTTRQAFDLEESQIVPACTTVCTALSPPAPRTRFTDTSVASRVIYYYVVTAVNSSSGKESACSDQAAAKPRRRKLVPQNLLQNRKKSPRIEPRHRNRLLFVACTERDWRTRPDLLNHPGNTGTLRQANPRLR